MQHLKLVSGLVLTAVTGLAATSSLSAVSGLSQGPAIGFDIAMDGSSFSFEGDVNANGAPAAGTPFVIQGYIYPEGTFRAHGPLSGVLPDGSPEFPSMVLGTWTCRGWHLLDGDATTGVVVATNQIFDLSDGTPGSDTITTDGIELADFGVSFRRTTTGGTGMFADARGQHEQVYVGNGLNASGGFNTSFVFRVHDL